MMLNLDDSERSNGDQAMIMNIDDIDKYCNRGINRTSVNYDVAPFNDTCLQMFFKQLQDSLRRYTEWEEAIYTLIYIVISVLAVIGNGLVILAVIRKKAMRTNRNVLILNLALSNLVLAITNIPFLWLPSIDFEFPYSRFFCKFANVLPGSNVYCSTLTISVMAIDRYYSVKKLTLASNRRQCLRAILVSMLIWLSSFLLSLPLLLSYDTTILFVFKDVNVIDETSKDVIMRSYGWRQCRIAPSGGSSTDISSPQSVQLLMSVLQVLFLYVIPLIVLSIFNVKLTRFLKNNANQMSRNRIDRNGKEQKTVKECNGSTVEDAKPLRNTIAAPVVNTQMRSAERASERRTSRTTALLVAMAGSYAALWLPFTLITMLLDLGILYNEAQVGIIERIDQSCKVVSMLSICVNPFLYGFLNTNFRHEFTEIYYKWVRCASKGRYSTRFAHEYSSVAFPMRNNSIHIENETLLTTLQRGFRGSLRVMRDSFRSQGSRNSSISCQHRLCARSRGDGLRSSVRSDCGPDRPMVYRTPRSIDHTPENSSVV